MLKLTFLNTFSDYALRDKAQMYIRTSPQFPLVTYQPIFTLFEPRGLYTEVFTPLGNIKILGFLCVQLRALVCSSLASDLC